MHLVVSGEIFLYIFTWKSASSSGLDNFPASIIWKVHTILANELEASSIYSETTVSPAHRGYISEILLSYSCLGAG